MSPSVPTASVSHHSQLALGQPFEYLKLCLKAKIRCDLGLLKTFLALTKVPGRGNTSHQEKAPLLPFPMPKYLVNAIDLAKWVQSTVFTLL